MTVNEMAQVLYHKLTDGEFNELGEMLGSSVDALWSAVEELNAKRHPDWYGPTPEESK